MGLNLGNIKIGSLYLGSTKIVEAYLGSVKVMSSRPIVYNVTCSGSHGTVTANPSSGIPGTVVTLSNSPDTGYEFDSYSLTGATLYDTNKFDINNSDVNVVGNFISSGPSFDEVTIGTQTWMAKNLAIDDDQGGIYTQTVNYGQGNVVEYYYTWDAAVRVANSINGWHLPSRSEWNSLISIAGNSTAGKKLKSTYGWSSGNGNGYYNFAAFPAGYWNSGSFNINSVGSQARFWTSDEYSSTKAYTRWFSTGSQINSNYYTKTSYAHSIRLIKDS